MNVSLEQELEKTKIELEKIKIELEKIKIELEKTKIELEKKQFSSHLNTREERIKYGKELVKKGLLPSNFRC